MKHSPLLTRAADPEAAALAWLMFLIPALGVPSLLVLQDTLKSAVAAIGILSITLLFCSRQSRSTSAWQWHGLMWLPLALMLYALGSTLWSHAFLGSVEAIRWFLLGILLWLGLNVLTRDNVPTVAWGVHLGIVVASVWAALQFWLDWQFFPQGPRPASTFVNRNFFAEYAVCAFPASVWLLATLRSTPGLVAMALSVGFNLVVIFMTGTRSGLIAIAVVLPGLFLALGAFRRQFAFPQWSSAQRWLAAAILVATVWGLGSVPSGNAQIVSENLGQTALQRATQRATSMAQQAEYTRGSFSVRAQMWMATARMFLAHPLEGVGAGAWEVDIPLYQRVDTVLETDYYAHNEYLQLLSEYGGIVGGLVLATLLAYLLQAAAATWRLRESDATEAPIRILALGPLLAMSVVGNAGFPLHLAACGTLLALCLGVLASSDSRLKLRDTLRATAIAIRPVYVRASLIGLVVCMGLAIYISIQAARVESRFVQALQQMVAYRQNLQVDPALAATFKSEALQNLAEAMAINPHYRKLSAELAEPLAASGDWENAIWILESIAASRPHLAAIWSGLALGYTSLGQHEQAQRALSKVQELKPDASRTVTLEAIMLSQSGQGARAAQLLNQHFDTGTFDFDMAQAGYAIGFRTQQWALAIRALELRNARWPEFAADGYLRLGKLYCDPAINNPAKALAAFKSGLSKVPPEDRQKYILLVPEPYRAQM